MARLGPQKWPQRVSRGFNKGFLGILIAIENVLVTIKSNVSFKGAISPWVAERQGSHKVCECAEGAAGLIVGPTLA